MQAFRNPPVEHFDGDTYLITVHSFQSLPYILVSGSALIVNSVLSDMLHERMFPKRCGSEQNTWYYSNSDVRTYTYMGNREFRQNYKVKVLSESGRACLKSTA